jgi:hypothetical protein
VVCCRITNQLVKLFGAALKKAAKKSRRMEKKIVFFISCLGECCAPSGEGIFRRGDGGGLAPRSEMLLGVW